MDVKVKEMIQQYESIFIPESSRLSTNEKKELHLRAVNGDLLAKNKFIEANLDLVAAVVKSFMRDEKLRNHYDDLFQEGSKALVEAFDKYESSRGITFKSFAIKYIFWKLERSLKKINNNIYFDNTYDLYILGVENDMDTLDEKLENKERLDIARKIIKSMLLNDCLDEYYTKEGLTKIFDFCRLYQLTSNYKTDVPKEYLLQLNEARKNLNEEFGYKQFSYYNSELFELYKYVYRRLVKIDLIIKYVMLPGEKQLTLQQIADYYGVSKQAVDSNINRTLVEIKNYVIDNEEEFKDYYDVSKVKIYG